MRCSEVQDRLAEFIRGQLPAEQMDSARKHLEKCRKCRHDHWIARTLIRSSPKYSGATSFQSIWVDIIHNYNRRKASHKGQLPSQKKAKLQKKGKKRTR